MTIVDSHHTAFQVAGLARSRTFCQDTWGSEPGGQRVSREERVRQIVGYPDAELHQALPHLPGSDASLEVTGVVGR